MREGADPRWCGALYLIRRTPPHLSGAREPPIRKARRRGDKLLSLNCEPSLMLLEVSGDLNKSCVFPRFLKR